MLCDKETPKFAGSMPLNTSMMLASCAYTVVIYGPKLIPNNNRGDGEPPTYEMLGTDEMKDIAAGLAYAQGIDEGKQSPT